MKQLFRQAWPLAPAERDALIENACAGDPSLAAEVRELLADAPPLGFLESPALGPGAAAASAPETVRIPGFELCERLAAGASGTVFRAWQVRPRREVALKLMRANGLGPGQVARFQREAQILAELEHPGIARVIESGTLQDGTLALPWIALEFVRGVTLDQHVAAQRPALTALLAVMIDVCDALEHAHKRGIVHRDLKPSNLMVDGEGRVRVLDFGVARGPLVGQEENELRTRTGMLIGTLGYMAPEQAQGLRDPTPAADVYSLGAMLFELLTGRLPIDVDERELLDAVRAVCVQEPRALRSLRPDLPRDLETVLAKTLEKTPARRYRSAGELGQELRRFLARQPVQARRATLVYRTGKLVRRNPALFAALTAVFLALVAGLALALAGLREARIESARTSATLDAFATMMLRFTPLLGFGQGGRADLEQVLVLVEDQLGRDPRSRSLRVAQAQLLTQIAVLAQASGDHDSMARRMHVVEDLWSRLTSEDPGDLEAWTSLSAAYARLGEAGEAQGRLDERDRWYARALELDERLVREHPGDLELLEDLGWSLERVARARSEAGDLEHAMALHLRRLADAEALVSREPRSWKFLKNLSHVQYYLAGLCLRRGEFERAAEFSTRSVLHARLVCELEPSRRNELEWLVDACSGARDVLAELGRIEPAREFAVEALDRAAQLLLADVTRSDHLQTLRWRARDVVNLEEGPDRLVAARRTAARLGEVATLLGDPDGRVAEGLRELVAELEPLALAARAAEAPRD